MNGDGGLPLSGEILPPVRHEPVGSQARMKMLVPYRISPAVSTSPDLRYFKAPLEDQRRSMGLWSAAAVIACTAFLAVVLAQFDWAQPSLAQGPARFEVVQLKSRVQIHGQKGTLVVDGTLRNTSTESRDLPPLRVRVISRTGNVRFFALDAASNSSLIAAGAQTVISARYPVADDGVRSVSILIP